MTSPSILSLALLAAALGAGCAADATRTAEAPAEREYRTGSNIPKKEARPVTEEERQRAAEQAEELKRNSAAGRPYN